MKTLSLLPIGLMGSLLLVAGCGSSDNSNNGQPDASPGGDSGSPDGGSPDGTVQPSCGDNVVNAAGEECDDGAKNGSAGDPCTPLCKWVCIAGDATRGNAACNTGTPNACAGMATCAANHTCTAGTPLDAGASCGNGMVCNSGICGSAVCGDGIVESGEQCDDGAKNGTPTDGCNSNCQWVCQMDSDCSGSVCSGTGTCTVATHLCSGSPPPDGTMCGDGGTEVCKAGKCIAGACGDGVRETGEQCDDGNTTNLDGCNSTCQFEQDHRATSVSIASTTDTFCKNNALGTKALGGLALGQLNTSLQTAVKAGTTTIAFEFVGITDLTGATQAAGLSLGSLTGTPATSGSGDAGAYDGTNDVDWWYTTAANSIDANRLPTSVLAATFASSQLSATGSIILTVQLAGANAVLDFSSTKIQSAIGAATTPLTSAGGTPGHLSGEHLDPALKSFQTMTAGLLCGNISAQSLAGVPVPTLLTTTFKCAEGYSSSLASNSLLDVIVNGCTVIIGVITPTQPDQTSNAPAVGAGAPYTFTKTGNHVTGCNDSSNASVDLNKCLAAAAYSAYFDFASDRVIMK
jgi:cysteine-rich repeat protein